MYSLVVRKCCLNPLQCSALFKTNEEQSYQVRFHVDLTEQKPVVSAPRVMENRGAMVTVYGAMGTAYLSMISATLQVSLMETKIV